ncbi:MAG TPA: ABC transporter ATP-binding protein [Clostridiales bacterium]|jgi:putative ABC transport system ATP-binding protein|nr:ABC transporter ATP-binding protein [Clostridiales bacterium]
MIWIEGLCKTYNGRNSRGQGSHGPVRALDGINLSVDPGEFVAIVGSSGSGKSTLMNLLGLLDRPDKGTYYLQNRDMFSLPDTKLSKVRRKEIGFIFQSFNLIPRLTALENVMLPQVFAGIPRKKREELAMDALARVGLSDRISHLPSQLSGGQMQRVAIARALVGRPKLILADEPTGNLDEASTAQILSLLQSLHRSGATILLITHDKDVAAYAGRTIRIHAGRIIGDTGQSK